MERVLLRMIVGVVVTAVLLVAADRAAAALVARSVAQGLTSAQRLARPATVTFGGLPFLTQVAAGRYDAVDVTMTGVPTVSALVIDRLDAHLHGVRARAGTVLRGELTQLRVDRGEAEGFASFGALERAADAMLGRGVTFTLTRAAGDRVAFSARITSFLGAVVVRGQARVAVHGGAVVLRLLPETLIGVSPALWAQIVPQVDLSHLVPALPFGFRATGVIVDPSGLRLQVTGHGLIIPV